MQCVRQDWDNWTQNKTIVLVMGALERGKAGLVDFSAWTDLVELRGPREVVQRYRLWS